METAIARLHRISPETTEEVIAYAASVYLNLEGDTNYTPWDAAVRIASNYGINYDPDSRVMGNLGIEDSTVTLASAE